MSQLATAVEVETTDSDGHTTKSLQTTFLGLYGIIYLPISSFEDIKILPNSKSKKFNNFRVEMESVEFERYFDVFSLNRVGAMKILTQDSIEKLVKLRNIFKKNIKIRINKNRIYFAIYCGDIFEPPTFRSAMNFDILYKYFCIIDTPKLIYEAVIDNIVQATNSVDFGVKRAKEDMTDFS